MRAVFMGTPPAAVPSLRALASAHEVVGVYTQPDRPRGRGRKVQPSPVKKAATELGLTVFEPATMRDADEQDRLRSLGPDVVAVVAFGQILPVEVLEAPRLGAVNVHFSLLPRWRGAAPVERGIMAGDTTTGVTTMLMDEGLDTGPVLLTLTEPIGPEDTAGDVLDRLSQTGAGLLVRTLAGLEDGSVQPVPQPEEGATYARKITQADAQMDLNAPALELRDLVRGLNPDPGAFTVFRERRLKVWRADASGGTGTAGEIVELATQGPVVQTGDGRLTFVEVQPEGKARMTGAEFVRGYRPGTGEKLGGTG